MHGTDLIINGQIVLEGDVMNHEFCSWIGEGCFSARMVREALAQFPGAATMRVNSPGGDPVEGEAIRAAIDAHAGEVTVIVGGWAASAASLLIMAAARIEMTLGSLMMIHEPSGGTYGVARALRQEADRLDVLSGTYAAVYAARAGIEETVARQMMADETWFGAADAVAAGFADAIYTPQENGQSQWAASASLRLPPAQAQAQSQFAANMAGLIRKIEKFNASGGNTPAHQPTAPAGHSPAVMAAQEEVLMEPDNVQPAANAPEPVAAIAPAAPETTMQVDPAEIARRAVEGERARVVAVTEMAAPFAASGQLNQADIQAVLAEGATAESAGNRFMAIMATRDVSESAGGGSGPRVRITRDETQTRMEGMIAAMRRDYSGPGDEFRGLRLRNLAMQLAGSGSGFNDTERVRQGMMSTTMMGGALGVSDFSYITTEVMNRSVISEYESRDSSWQLVSGAPEEASDFREMNAVRFGGDFQLKTVKENGEYQESTLKDEAEGLKVERRGRTINLTFEAVINDDMGIFARIPRKFAEAARIMESSMVWTLFRENKQLKSDSLALFHTTHKNLAGAGSVLSVTSVGAARKAMWEQTAFGTKDKDDFLSITPNQLIVPPALETVAMQFTAGTTPTKDADANPYKNSLTSFTVPHLGAAATGGSDTAWYLTSSDLPPISVAYLDGYASPTVQTIEGMNPDKVTMNARHMFGAAVTEFRGAYKNAGA